jgi:hypothetical protein
MNLKVFLTFNRVDGWAKENLLVVSILLESSLKAFTKAVM